jgi:hypothetical protein
MNYKYTILYAAHYIGRELYLLKINNSYIKLYKSSGLAGHNSKGTLLRNEKHT